MLFKNIKYIIVYIGPANKHTIDSKSKNGIIENRKYFINIVFRVYLILDSLFLKNRLNYAIIII